MEFIDRKPANRPLRRNDIVCDTRDSLWTPFGRVNRVIDADTVEVAWGKDGICLEEAVHLQVHNAYRGYWDRGIPVVDPETGGSTYPHPVFRRMPSLRRLKQRAICWGRGAWACDRERFEAEKAEQQAIWDAEGAADEAAKMKLAA